LGTLLAAQRKGLEIAGGFTATLDLATPVLVTAVLERTGVYEVVGAPLWYGRHLATLDRLTVEDPSTLTYRENKRWLLNANSAERGRRHPGRGVAVKVKSLDLRRCPGSNQPIGTDVMTTYHGKVSMSSVTCSVCGQKVTTYERQVERFKSAHVVPLESEGPVQ
jgi:hypothetical protein